MTKCCVCGREASIRAHGLWWCEEHYERGGVKTKELTGKGSRGEDGVKASVNLGLNWI